MKLPWRARNESRPKEEQEPIVQGLGPICEVIRCFLGALARLDGVQGFALNPYAPLPETLEIISKMIEEHKDIYAQCLYEKVGL